jgi:hypothetical protein
VQNVQKRVLSFAHWKPLQGKALRVNVQKRAKKRLPSAGFGKNKNTWHFYFLQCVGTEVFLRSLLNIYSTTLIYQGFQPPKNVQKLKTVFEHFAHFSGSFAVQGFATCKNVQ